MNVDQQDINRALFHIRKAERSQGPMNDEQRRELLEDKTAWTDERIWAVVDAIPADAPPDELS
jgi:hypothetical protein